MHTPTHSTPCVGSHFAVPSESTRMGVFIEKPKKAARKPLTEAQRAMRDERGRLWILANPDRHKEYHRRYMREWARAQVLANPAKAKERIEKQKDNHRQYVLDHREQYNAYSHRRRASECGAAGSVYTLAVHITQRCQMFGGRCWLCGGEAIAVDHVKPISKGGSHYPSNLRPACMSCNSSKLAKWPFPTTIAAWKTPISLPV